MDTYYCIEKVADLVDRSLDPIAAEEFGHPMILASEYVQDAQLSRLSLWLEDHYFSITEKLSFPGPLEIEKGTIKKSAVFSST